jgi:hypothetical protein
VDAFLGPKILDYQNNTPNLWTRRWSMVWERQLADINTPDAPPFVVESGSAERYLDYLDEYAIGARKLGKEALSSNIGSLLSRTSTSEFEQRYVEPWMAMTKAKREEIVLEVLRLDHLARADGPQNWEQQRSLVPEITLQEMAGNGGAGFVTLLRRLLDETIEEDGETWLSFATPRSSALRIPHRLRASLHPFIDRDSSVPARDNPLEALISRAFSTTSCTSSSVLPCLSHSPFDHC